VIGARPADPGGGCRGDGWGVVIGSQAHEIKRIERVIIEPKASHALPNDAPLTIEHSDIKDLEDKTR
jgi:hypothetical protein